MRLTALDVRDVRLVRSAALEPGGDVNLLLGPNATGKTSLLEAIHILATGRSFAASRTARVVRVGGGPLRVVGRVQRGVDGTIHRLGIERGSTGPARMRIDGRPAERMAELARLLPVIAIHPQSHELIMGGPGERRRLLDLGLFHVEQRFHDLWQRYRRALSQRNVLLRKRVPESQLGPWEMELARTGEQLDEFRRHYVDSLTEVVTALAPALFGDAIELELEYRRGWHEGESLGDALSRLRSRDVEQRVTGVGPHRADLVIRIDGRDVRQRISRGQQKLLVYLLRLAQARQLAAVGDGSCVLLLDDLPAELDADRRARVMAAAVSVGAQCFVTALEKASVPIPDNVACNMFHVEQGEVSEVVH
ncbi:MAG: DNA replication/repair protein RecF [Halofilum sp. (in: g-proteobacteria)]|nr:DNA replication/repair protein RecF [Halofilum sp. (in: g-proteobacteria)]